MEKVSFALDVKDGWPPVAVEHVWCERVGSGYELKNAPFFIPGLAFGDQFVAQPDPVNGLVFEFEVVEESGNSLVWVLERDNQSFEGCRDEVLNLGCGVEGFPAFRLYSINIPASVDAFAIDAAMDKLESVGFALAFPVWRHEPGSA